MKEDLRDVFVILKGSFIKKKPLVDYEEESFYIGGYDPEDENTREWYKVINSNTGNCIHASESLDKALKAIKREIIRSKTYKGHIKSINKFSLGDGELMKKLNRCLCEEFGWYYDDLIREMEDDAYAFLKDNTDVKKAKRRFKSIGIPKQSEKRKEEQPKKQEKGMKLHRIRNVMR